MPETRIRTFWLSNPDYWIAIGPKQHAADKLIYSTFYNYDYTQEDTLGQVIYLDQFMRHFSRITTISENTIRDSRIDAARLVMALTPADWSSTQEDVLIWYLMPWKHLHDWPNIFSTINTWLNNRPLTDFPTLNRYFMDTYTKAYSPATVAETIQHTTEQPIQFYDANQICDSYPLIYADPIAWATIRTSKLAQPLINAFTPYTETPITISLSGGVDSMLMAALLIREGFDVVAIHIVYGNRTESPMEQNFVETYCYRLGIPLYIYTIEHLKRAQSDRAFYESATRDLRFSAYKALKRPVLLGHIQEDVVENIWTNFAHGTHLDNPAKFAPEALESGVKICRPWLHIKKELIYAVASELMIPYLKNTTPAWSNRGKFRTDFYAATHAQYGPQVDQTLISVASRLKQQAAMLDKLLYQAISNSWDPTSKRINITTALTLNLGHDDWLRIFTDLAHNKLHIQKPSLKACAEFVHRTSKGLQHNTSVNLKKGFVVKVLINDDQTWLQVL